MTGFDVGQGYVDGKLVFDYNDARLLTNVPFSMSNASQHSLVIWMVYRQNNTSTQAVLWSVFDGTTTRHIRVHQPGSLAPKDFGHIDRAGGVVSGIQTSPNLFNEGDTVMVTHVKDGSAWRFDVFGTTAPLSSTTTYAKGDAIFTNNQRIGSNSGELASVASANSDILAVMYFKDVAISEARSNDIYSLGPTLGGMRGFDNGDGTMRLEPAPQAVQRTSKPLKFRQYRHTGRLR